MEPNDFSSLDGLKICICVLAGSFFLGLSKLIVEWSYSTLVIIIAAVGAVLSGAVRSLVSLLSVPEEQLRSESLDRATETENLRAEVQQLRQQLAATTAGTASGVNPLRSQPPVSSSLSSSRNHTLPSFSTPIRAPCRTPLPALAPGRTQKSPEMLSKEFRSLTGGDLKMTPSLGSPW